METVGEKRSTWTRWNLHAEASRQLMGWRFASIEDREAITGLVVDAAERASLRLTPPELATSPLEFRRPDGTTRFRPRHSTLFSSEVLLVAEDRLLARAEKTTGPTVLLETVERIARKPDARGRVLGEDQAAALAAIAVSGRVVDVLVGPAGAGKTTAMSALRRAWEKEHGAGSVVGLAPSATAAHVLADDLGIATENTAKWWQNHLMHGTTFEAGQLVIIDEASLAGTASLDRITHEVEKAGAKALLVGDWGQLQSVDAGGAFGLLVHSRDDVPELHDLHRFTHAWEKTTSLQLRHGRSEAIDTLIEHDRITGGEAETMIDAAYTAWQRDLAAGRASILVAETHETVTTLNARARADRIIDGQVNSAREVALHDGTAASEGDLVITRHNDRRLRNGRTWVRNGSRWIVTAVREDGSVSIRPAARRFGGGIVLPADYVAEHLDLGYAITAHRAQGVTTQTSHVVVTPTTTRENFYVSMTRGAEGNNAYVAIDREDHEHSEPHPGDNPNVTARSVLYGVLQHVGAELSAHETIASEQERWGSITQLAGEYETIAQAAQHDRWVALLAVSGLTPEQVGDVLDSDAYGALSAELRHAEANHHDLDALLPRLVGARSLADADDVASVIHARLARATVRPYGSGRTRKPPRMIVGLVPDAGGAISDEMRQALDERRDLIEQRADAVLHSALTDEEPWTAKLGMQPKDKKRRAAWRRAARTVAAYRDRYQITDERSPFGPVPESTSQKIDAARARAALNRAQSIASDDPTMERMRPTAVTRSAPRL